jgi:thioesterase domain-containing protein/acyl carrier protein
MLLLWRRVLNVPEIAPDDDFFALGGHSILAAQLFASIERELGCTAPLATLYDAATPRALASVLSLGTKVEDWQSLVAINRSGDRPPLFLVHPAEGHVLPYRALAAHLGADQPVFGLQSAGLDGRSPIDGQFEYVAQGYLEEIRQVRPHGPYMLGGYGLGGTLALEMAQQLIASGENVGLLALIESYNVRAVRWPLPLHQRLLNRFVLNPFFHLEDFLAAENAVKSALFREQLRAQVALLKETAHSGWAGLRDRQRSTVPDAPTAAKVAKTYERTLAQYNVKPYPGELVLFLTDRHPAGFPDRLGGWAEVVQGGVRLFPLPGNPGGSLAATAVEQTALLLRGCLDLAIEHAQVAAQETGLNLVGRY